MLIRLCTLLVVGVCVAVEGVPQRTSPSTGVSVASAGGALNKRNTNGDNAAEGTGFHHHGHHHHGGQHLGHAGHGQGKFFMYAHQPEHKHYEFGFKRGNDKHVVERYEKGGPHHNFKSKFRWHDKHGGHGERYWDYNHGPSHHHDDGGDDSHHHSDDSHHHHDDGSDHHDDGHHGYSEPVPEYVAPSKDGYRQRRKSTYDDQNKKNYYQKKPTGLQKKQFVGPKEQNSYRNNPFLSSDPLQAPSNINSQPSISQTSFGDMLGFDPFSPPDILKNHATMGASNNPTMGASSHSTMEDSSHPMGASSHPTMRANTVPIIAPPSYRQTTQKPVRKPYFTRNQKPKKFMPKKYRPANKAKIFEREERPQLAFDLDSGRVYDERTGKWFRLVAD